MISCDHSRSEISAEGVANLAALGLNGLIGVSCDAGGHEAHDKCRIGRIEQQVRIAKSRPSANHDKRYREQANRGSRPCGYPWQQNRKDDPEYQDHKLLQREGIIRPGQKSPG